MCVTMHDMIWGDLCGPMYVEDGVYEWDRVFIHCDGLQYLNDTKLSICLHHLVYLIRFIHYNIIICV